MNSTYPLSMTRFTKYMFVFTFSFLISDLTGQITPPGYEREMEMRKAEKTLSRLDRDSVTVTDTVIVFDPSTYEESTTITITNYSLRDFCKNFLGMPNPDILLDGKPHTIVDPRNYGDLMIRLNEAGKIDTIPPKQ
jgi:hypothetical protein